MSEPAPKCETPKSPPGDYNHADKRAGTVALKREQCETPKSPPGDYNSAAFAFPNTILAILGVKHLNPRQGITIHVAIKRIVTHGNEFHRVKHLNPRQGITM